MPSTWFITGVSRGLGRALASAALADGDTVVGTSRSGVADLPPSERLHVVALDVTAPQQPGEAFAEAIDLAGDIDVVVNNAGYGLFGPVEASSEMEVSDIIDANLLGPIRVLRAALPHLRARGGGTVVNVSSIAALDPLPGSGIYAAAKAGLSAVSEALAAEAGPLGVRVISVEPGAFRTEFLSDGSMRVAATAIDAYASTSGRVIGEITAHAGRQAGDPERAARLIVDAVRAGEPPLHLVIGADAVGRARARVHRTLEDIGDWEARSIATAFAATTSTTRDEETLDG